jgi:hypothetical protein
VSSAERFTLVDGRNDRRVDRPPAESSLATLCKVSLLYHSRCIYVRVQSSLARLLIPTKFVLTRARGVLLIGHGQVLLRLVFYAIWGMTELGQDDFIEGRVVIVALFWELLGKVGLYFEGVIARRYIGDIDKLAG